MKDQAFLDYLRMIENAHEDGTAIMDPSTLCTNWTTSIIFSVVMTTASPRSYNVAEVPPFDTDSQLVGVDNRCSVCITNLRSDIPGEIVSCNRSIRGFGGAKVWNVWKGMIKWDIEDDEGVTHTHIIPNSYYIPQRHV